MSPYIVPVILAGYFFILLLLSRFTSRRAAGNDAFFRAGRRSPWPLVAFGMIGASISGVTFISVPGWAGTSGMTYLQMCMGFIVGYAAVAFVLLPVYYRLRLTSIYTLLRLRLGSSAHLSGSTFFVVSKLLGAAARLFVVCHVLDLFLTLPLLRLVSPSACSGLFSYSLTVCLVLLLIWLYTRRSGIQTIVRTDALQTLCLLTAAVGMLVAAMQRMGLDVASTWQLVTQSPMSRVWEWDAASPAAFWRQFVSGAFIVVVMTGLDQDMMQKNLTCSTLRAAQKDMLSYGLCFLPVNALFLGLGVVLYTFCARQGLTPPAATDDLLPMLVQSGALGGWVIVPFTVGMVAAAFSSADSALTALTTTICIDLLGMERKADATLAERAAEERLRRRVHLCLIPLFVACLLLFRVVGGGNILHAIYVMASYTYGPLLGLFAFALWGKRRVETRAVWAVCLAAPLLCALLDGVSPLYWHYRFGYELLLLNGLLTFLGLASLSRGGGRSHARRLPASSRRSQ